MENVKVPLSDELVSVIQTAKDFCVKYGIPLIGSEHLLYGMIETQCVAGDVLMAIGLNSNFFKNIFAEQEVKVVSGKPVFSDRVNRLFFQAARELAQYNQPTATPEHILLLILQDTTSYGYRVIADLKPNFEQMITKLVLSFKEAPKGENRHKGLKPLPAQLKEIGIDLTKKAREHKIDPVIGRSKEIERIIQILCRKTKNNPVLIGEPGVGKSAVVEGLALAIVQENVPELLKNKIVYALDIGGMVAGTKYRGALEEKLKTAIDLITAHGDIIVFIDELHTLSTAGNDKGEVTPSDMLKPYLARGELQTIGATTTDEYRKFIEADKALERRFQPITVDPPSVDETIEILKGIRENYEKFHNVKITDEAIAAAAQLSDRYIMDRFLPDKAIDLIDEASSKAKVSVNVAPPKIKELEEEYKRVEQEKAEVLRRTEYEKAPALRDRAEQILKEIERLKGEQREHLVNTTVSITADDIARIVASWTRIPVTRISETEMQRLNRLEEILHERVIGQDEAVVSVSKAIRRARAGLKDPNRPIGSFLFLGPTGVGKTELTKALAEAMFDDENFIIRLDMSEYMEGHSVSKMIGSPPGYVGYDEGGQLTEQVRRKPYSVVLFDEIEKAHPDVFNLLLQLLDEGRLTDAQGRMVNFKNTIIIMTSNVGIDRLKFTTKKLGFSDVPDDKQRDTKNILLSELKNRFKPEFLNRIDVITIFHSLDKKHLKQIVGIMLQKVAKKLKDKSIELKFTDDAIDKLIEEGYDAEYGARPLRRKIEQHIEDNLAEAILSGAIKEGDIVEIGIKNGEYNFLATGKSGK